MDDVDSTVQESYNDTSGFSYVFTPGDDTSSSGGPGEAGAPDYLGTVLHYSAQFLAVLSEPENASGGGLLSTVLSSLSYCAEAEIGEPPWGLDRIAPAVPPESGGETVSLEDWRTQQTYVPPLTVIVYRGGLTVSEGESGGESTGGFNLPGALGTAAVAADTDSATPGGLPNQEEAKLTTFVSNTGSSDEVSRNGPEDPTAMLVALAAPGRDPTDITIPVLAGSEGSGDGGGGDDAVVAGPRSGSTTGSSSSSQSSASASGSGNQVASAGSSSSSAESSPTTSADASGSTGSSTASSGSGTSGTSPVAYATAGGSSSSSSSSTSTGGASSGSAGKGAGGAVAAPQVDGEDGPPPGSHEVSGGPSTMGQKSRRSVPAQPVPASGPPGELIMGMTEEHNTVDTHQPPVVSPEDEARAMQFLFGMSLITASFGGATPFVAGLSFAKGVDEVQAAARGEHTAVYQGAKMVGAPDGLATAVDVASTMPGAFVGFGEGAIAMWRKMAVQGARKSLVLSAEEAGSRVAGAAAKAGAEEAIRAEEAAAEAAVAPNAASATEDFFAGTNYTDKVRAQMQVGDNHSFPESVKNFQGSGTVSKITGGDGVTRDILRIPGTYNGRSGVFEFIKEADGSINHRFFKVDRP